MKLFYAMRTEQLTADVSKHDTQCKLMYLVAEGRKEELIMVVACYHTILKHDFV